MLLGSHVSMSGKKMLLGAAEEAASYGSSTFMIYTGAPQNTRRKAIEEMNIDAGKAFMAENGLTNISFMRPISLIWEIRSNQKCFHLLYNF